MKPLISKGLLFIGMACAFQANAAIIQLTEDSLTIDTAAWYFEEQNPTFPASGNTVLATDNNRSQTAFLGLNGQTRTSAWTEGNFDFGYAARAAHTFATGTGSGIAIHAHTYVDEGPSGYYGYGVAGWNSISQFTVDGNDASLDIFGTIRTQSSPNDSSFEAYLGFELIDETEGLTLASLLPGAGNPTGANINVALHDEHSYTLTTTGYLRAPFLSDSSNPRLWVSVNNASVVTVPEPSTALLLLLGTLGMGWAMKGRNRLAKV